MSLSLDIRIILVKTFQPQNIGSVARAMKTMGLDQLYLVDPVHSINDDAYSLAAGAKDILKDAITVDTLEQALDGCSQVFATTARQRHFSRPQRTVKEAAHWINTHPNERIAIVFGRERMGLSNEDIDLAQQILYIPANEAYGILNLAQAVQVVCYEIFQANLENQPAHTHNDAPVASEVAASKGAPVFASQQALSALHEHMQSTFRRSGFLRRAHEGEALQKLKQLLARAAPNQTEVRMLRGLLTSIDRLASSKDDPTQ